MSASTPTGTGTNASTGDGSPRKQKGQAPQPPIAAAAPAPNPPMQAQQSQDDGSRFETGGLSDFRPTDSVITAAVTKLQEQIRAKIKETLKVELPSAIALEIVGYRMNIVLGFMYFAKIKVNDTFVQVKILESPQGEVSLQNVGETKTEEDEREYFKLPKKH